MVPSATTESYPLTHSCPGPRPAALGRADAEASALGDSVLASALEAPTKVKFSISFSSFVITQIPGLSPFLLKIASVVSEH